jgi:hypothetical protein
MVMTEEPESQPSNSRSVRGSRALPDLLTRLLTGTPNRYKWLGQSIQSVIMVAH